MRAMPLIVDDDDAVMQGLHFAVSHPDIRLIVKPGICLNYVSTMPAP